MKFSATPSATWELPTRRLGRRTIIFDRLDSTNTYALSQADNPANDGLVVLAREQTGGRGQHGRSWQAPAGSSVLLSVLVFPPPTLRRPAVLTAWAGVSVCQTIFELAGLHGQIKWPNDVLVSGRKVCGILIEQRTVASCQLPVASEERANASLATGNWQLATICGIGLNINQTTEHFAAAGLEEAGSLALFNRHEIRCDEAAHLLIQQLDTEYDRLTEGEMAPLETAWKERLGLLGKFVVAECGDCEYQGWLRDVGWDGVRLDTPSGPVCLLPETVGHLRPA